MKKAFLQGWLDSLCGVYSIVNAHKILFNATEEQSQEIFNSIIEYLSKKRKLKTVIIEGMTHPEMGTMLDEILGDTVPIKHGNMKNIATVNEWWNIAMEHMNGGDKRAIILALDGKDEHYTVVSNITDKSMQLFDSSEGKTIRKGSCKLKGYKKDDKYIIYPAQCWFLGL